MLEKQSMPSELIERTPDFLRAFDILEDSNDNLFITGKAGTGKSTFLEYFRAHTSKKVAVLAPTGVAALNVRGQTIHSFFKFKPRLLTANSIKRHRSKIYRHLELLIIDEISMVRADVFDAIERFLRINGPHAGKPFGGVQLCVIGDLFQLPPIVSPMEKDIFNQLYQTPFFFGSQAFEMAQFGLIELTKIYRQSEDRFIDILNAIRRGDRSDAVISTLNTRYHKEDELTDYSPVVLATTNAIAQRINAHKLQMLKTPEFVYEGTIKGDFGLNDQKLPAPEQLSLKVGAQVMFTKNHSDKQWVNGTIGMVASLSPSTIEVAIQKNGRSYCYEVEKEKWETIKYGFNEEAQQVNEEVVGKYTQYPLIPAWAVTIHKSQGKTLDTAVINLGAGAFAPGQLYVALSRCRNFDRIALTHPIKPSDVLCDSHVVEFTKNF